MQVLARQLRMTCKWRVGNRQVYISLLANKAYICTWFRSITSFCRKSRETRDRGPFWDDYGGRRASWPMPASSSETASPKADGKHATSYSRIVREEAEVVDPHVDTKHSHRFYWSCRKRNSGKTVEPAIPHNPFDLRFARRRLLL